MEINLPGLNLMMVRPIGWAIIRLREGEGR